MNSPASSFARMDAKAADELHHGWLELLARYEWDWFVTLTFADVVPVPVADRLFRVWIASANRRAYGRRWFKHRQQIQWVLATEWQRRNVIHFHALMTNIRDLRRQGCERSWRNLGGGFLEMTPVRSQARAAIYVAKVLEFGGELDFGGWTAQRVPPGLNKGPDRQR